MKITKKQNEKLKNLTKKYDIKLIILFGSFANNTNKIGSDFDIAILGNSIKIAKYDADLIKHLTKILEKDIDLSIINNSDPLLKFEIARGGILIYGSKKDFIVFKTRASLEYMDNKKFFDLEEKYLKKIYA
jgi:uncharacterized protein